jgi:DNA-directed RNA polymerase subunit M/transcription elongation factor TFIIS
MWRKCKCGEDVLIPKKTDKKTVKCPKCGALAPLKKRNGRVRGLKFGFHKPTWA